MYHSFANRDSKLLDLLVQLDLLRHLTPEFGKLIDVGCLSRRLFGDLDEIHTTVYVSFVYILFSGTCRLCLCLPLRRHRLRLLGQVKPNPGGGGRPHEPRYEP